MLYFQDEARVSVWSVEDKGNYSVVRMSSGRKDKKTGGYINSNWSFVRFVGDAHEKITSVDIDPKKGVRIMLKGAGISWEPYMKDGEKAWAKNPQIVVFNLEFVDGPKEKEEPEDNGDGPSESSSDDDFPFD